LFHIAEKDAQFSRCCYQPVRIPVRGTFVYVLDRLVLGERPQCYYLVIVGNPDGASHRLVQFPPGKLADAQTDALTVTIKGDVGIVPAYDVGLMRPYLLPSLVYHVRPNRTIPARFSSRVVVTNATGHIQGGNDNTGLVVGELRPPCSTTRSLAGGEEEGAGIAHRSEPPRRTPRRRRATTLQKKTSYRELDITTDEEVELKSSSDDDFVGDD
jgi:hypothetical protein